MPHHHHRPFRRHRHHPPHPAPTPIPFPTPPPVPTPTPTPPPTPSAQPNWPTFTGMATLIGTSVDHVSVWLDFSLGKEGIDNANALLLDADRMVGLNNHFFGLTAPQPVNVLIYAIGGLTNGEGGADHAACNFVQGGDIEVDASFGSSARVSALFEAELSECAMGGNLCGLSTGEALSRWCAMVVSNNALSDFVTVPAWVSAGKPDYVTQIDPTDQDAVSIGCGMAFISWVLSQGKTLAQVAQQMDIDGDSGNFSTLYQSLGLGASAIAFTNFISAINALPSGSLSTDDPFGALSQAVASV